MTALTLSTAALHELPPEVSLPTYREDPPRVGIAHIGIGNFHRSHQAMYIDRLLRRSPGEPWAICAIGMRPEDRAVIAAMRRQDHLYSLSLFPPDGPVESRVIGAIREVVPAVDEPDAALERLSDPAIRIVSLTITESGYVEDPTSGRRAADDVDVRADAARGFSSPGSAFGLITAALRARREAGTEPFTVLSCDNIQNNGQVARASVVATARLLDEELAAWIDEHVAFPSTMVDRITPRATAQQLAVVEQKLGVRDDAAVVAEPFVQWVVEDDFSSGRPGLEEVGVVFTDDIAAYESMKLRLLNGAHQVLAYTGILRGHVYVHDAVRDPVVHAWLDRYWRELALPAFVAPPGVDGVEYTRTLIERFGNAATADTLERLAADSSDRMAKFVLPVLLDARGRPNALRTTAAILASWAVAVSVSSAQVIVSGVPSETLAAMRSAAPAHRLLATLGWAEPLLADPALCDEISAAMEALRGADAAAALERLEISSRR